MKEKTFKVNCVICGKPQEYVGRKAKLSKEDICLCSRECSLKYAEKELKLQRKNSVLPEWLFKKGVIDYFPNIHFRNYEKVALSFRKKDLKKIKSKKEKEVALLGIRYQEEVLKQPNTYYLAKDVERAFKEAHSKKSD